MIGGVISDIFAAEDRNTPMASYAGFALFGTGFGPMIAGIVAYRASWRWIYYIQAIAAAVVVIPLIFFFHETRGSVLLSRKAKVLNKWYDALEEAGYVGLDVPINDDEEKRCSRRVRWKVKSDEERDSLWTMLTISIFRPFRQCHLYSSPFLNCGLNQLTTVFRSPLYGTGGIFLLPLGSVQLGSLIYAIRCDSDSIRR